MHPDLESFLQNFDPREPLLLRWALNLIGLLYDGPDEAAAEAMEARLATPEFMTALFDSPDATLVSKALATLSASSFRPVADQLEALWETGADEPHPHWGLTRVLGTVDPERAARLFEKAIKDEEQHSKLPQIAVALRHFPAERARPLAHALISEYEAFARSAPEDTLAPDFLFELAWQQDHPKALQYIGDFIAGEAVEGRRTARWYLVPLAFELGDAAAEYHLACDRLEQRAAIDLVDLAPFYSPETDLARLDGEMGRVGLRRYAGVPDLVAQYAPRMGDRRLAALLTDLTENADVIDRLHKKRQRPYFYALILALLLRSQRRKRPDCSALSIEAGLDLLGADVTLLVHRDALVAWLAAMDPADVVAPLRRRLASSETRPPSRGLMDLAGRLAHPELTAALFALPPGDDADDDYGLGLADALRASGDHYFALVERHWDELEMEKRMLALRVAAGAVSEGAARFVEAHFDFYWQLDRERLLLACPLLGVDCRRRLEPLVNKHQPLLDETWLTLALLRGDRSETVQALLNAHLEEAAEKQDRIDAMLAPDTPPEELPAYVDLDLHCSHCGETFAYRLNRIWVNTAAEGDYYPAEEFPCLGCNHLADYTLSGEGFLSLTMRLMQISLAADEADFDALLERSPFALLPRLISYRGEKEIGEAIELCRRDIFQNREDPEPLFALGNIYVNIDHRLKARQCFENIIAMAPDAIEAYLMLAQMAIDKEDYADARRQLQRGEPHLEAPRMLMSAEVSGEQMVRLYRILTERLAQPEPDLSDIFANAEAPVLKREGIGRNDPCPCGSGKKYKKCCLNART